MEIKKIKFFNMMELTTELKYTIEILMLLTFLLGFLTSYIWSEHRHANKIHNENEKALREE